MSERVFADEFHKVFFERGIFLRLSRNGRKTLIGKRLKAASCGFIRLQTDSVLRLCWRKNCGRKERSVYLKTRWNTHG